MRSNSCNRSDSETPPPDVATTRAARAALLAHMSAAPDRRRSLPGLPMRLGRPRLLIAVAAFAVIVVLASGLLPMGLGPDAAAAAALNRAADIAALQVEGPNDGYRHTKSEGAWLDGFGGSPERPNGVWTLVPVSREIWIKPDGSGRLIESRGEPIWFGPADRAAWVAEGSPDFLDQPHSDTTFGPTPSGVDPSTSPTAAPQVWPGSLYYATWMHSRPTPGHCAS